VAPKASHAGPPRRIPTQSQNLPSAA